MLLITFSSQVTDTEIQEEPGKIFACSLPLKSAQTDPLGLNYCLPQDAVSQRMVPNVAGRATHAAVASLYLVRRQGCQTLQSVGLEHLPRLCLTQIIGKQAHDMFVINLYIQISELFLKWNTAGILTEINQRSPPNKERPLCVRKHKAGIKGAAFV